MEKGINLIIFILHYFVPFIIILFIIYFRYYRIPKNPILYVVVNYLPLQFIGFFFYLLYSADVAQASEFIQPQVIEEETPIEWGQQNEYIPDIPVLEEPLISDDHVRRVQLNQRLGPHSFVGQDISLRTMVDLVYQQAEIEKKIEAALVLDRIPRIRVLNELNRLRGVLFYPRGTPLKPATLARYIQEIAQSGTRQSAPYRRVIKAIQKYELFIDLVFFFHNNNQ